MTNTAPVLIGGATGKVGRPVVEDLPARGLATLTSHASSLAGAPAGPSELAREAS